MSTAVWVLWTSAGMQWRSTVGLFSTITTVIMPVTFIIVTARTVDDPGPETATRIVVAVALMSLWGSTVWGAGGVLRRELRDGTLAASVAGLYPPHLVLVGKSLGGTVYAVATIAPTTAVMVLLLGLPVRIAEPLWVVVGLLVVIASGTALGMLLACVFLLTKYGPQLSSALMYPIFLLGGLLIPPEVLPGVLQPIAAGISLRWASDFLVLAASGQVQMRALAAAVGLTVLYLVVGYLAFARIVELARRDGRFDL